MTVGTKLQQTMVQAKLVAAQLEAFALDTNNPQAQQLYRLLGRQCGDVASVLNTRLKALAQEEPEYQP